MFVRCSARRRWRIFDSLSGMASMAGLMPLRPGPHAHPLRQAAAALGRLDGEPPGGRRPTILPVDVVREDTRLVVVGDRRCGLPRADGWVVVAPDEASSRGRRGGAAEQVRPLELGAEA